MDIFSPQRIGEADVVYRVLLVHACPLTRLGGAELSLCHHLEHAPAGVQVDVITPGEPLNLSPYDAVVLANLRPEGGLGEQAEAAWAIEWTRRLSRYRGLAIRSEHDVHPCAHRDGRCLTGYPVHKLPCDCPPLIRKSFAELYHACSAVRFLSPAHQQAINSLIRVAGRQFVIASPVDLVLFRSVTPLQEREPVALITGDELRVSPTAVDRARRCGYQPLRVPYLSVHYEEMPALYNRCQAVVVEPVMFHAFGRIAVEALACGCRLLANDRVGALSWPDPLEATRCANEEFWNMVQGKWWGIRDREMLNPGYAPSR